MTNQAITQAEPTTALYKAADGRDVQLSTAIVRQYFCSAATEADAMLFVNVCRQLRANPFTNDVYLLKYGNQPASVVPSKDYYMKRADSIPEYDGMEHGVTVMDSAGHIVEREGQACYPQAGESLLGAWCKVYRTDRTHPTIAKVALSDFDKGKNLWKAMPAVMIDKVAQATALRQAFPNTFSGTYDAAELGDTDEPTQAQPAPMAVEVAAPVNVAEAQIQAQARPQSPSPQERAALIRASQAIGGDRAAVWDAFRSGGLAAVDALVAERTQPEEPEYVEPEPQPDADAPLPPAEDAGEDFEF